MGTKNSLCREAHDSEAVKRARSALSLAEILFLNACLPSVALPRCGSCFRVPGSGRTHLNVLALINGKTVWR
jgi:hypothetical protein